MLFKNPVLWRWVLLLIFLALAIYLAINGPDSAIYGADESFLYCNHILTRGKMVSVQEDFKNGRIEIGWQIASDKRIVQLMFLKSEVWSPAFYGESREKIDQLIVLNPGCRPTSSPAHTLLGPPELLRP